MHLSYTFETGKEKKKNPTQAKQNKTIKVAKDKAEFCFTEMPVCGAVLLFRSSRHSCIKKTILNGIRGDICLQTLPPLLG